METEPIYQIISTLLMLFSVSLSIFIINKAGQVFFHWKKLRKFKKLIKKHGAISIETYDKNGAPVVVKYGNKQEVL